MTWQRPSRCDSASCVEVAITPATVGIRTSDDPETTVVATHDEWRAHLAAVRAGEHDLPGDQPDDDGWRKADRARRQVAEARAFHDARALAGQLRGTPDTLLPPLTDEDLAAAAADLYEAADLGNPDEGNLNELAMAITAGERLLAEIVRLQAQPAPSSQAEQDLRAQLATTEAARDERLTLTESSKLARMVDELREQQHDILPLPGTLTTQQEIRHRALSEARQMYTFCAMPYETEMLRDAEQTVIGTASRLTEWIATGDERAWMPEEKIREMHCQHIVVPAGSPPPAQDTTATGPQTGLSATVPAEPGPQAPTDTTHPWRLDLDAITNQATTAHDWLKRAHAPQNGDWLPLSLRDHFDHAVPALIAEVRTLRAADDRTQAIVDATIAWRNAAGHHFDAWADDSDKALVAAVDQYQDTQ